MSGDPFRLDRFTAAQAHVFESAMAELKAGRKRSHWMWFVFPHLRGLGSSPRSDFYGLGSLAEAVDYLRDPLLGARLIACTEAVLAHEATPLGTIFGSPDDAKFVSCMTLFERAAGEGPSVFGAALDRLCQGRRDERTLQLLAEDADA